jgi:hypothetical protein
MSDTDTSTETFLHLQESLQKCYESYRAVWTDVISIWKNRLWVDKYESFEACMDALVRVKVSQGERAQAVNFFRIIGMSSRAIAAVLKVGQSTVLRDIQARQHNLGFWSEPGADEEEAPEPNGSPERTQGLDGKSYPAAKRGFTFNRPPRTSAPRAKADPDQGVCLDTKSMSAIDAVLDTIDRGGRLWDRIYPSGDLKKPEKNLIKAGLTWTKDEITQIRKNVYWANHGLKVIEEFLDAGYARLAS